MFRLSRTVTLLLLLGWSAGLAGADCNENGLEDTAEVANSDGDCNGNGIPDDCEGAPVPLVRREIELEVQSFPRTHVVVDFDGDGIVDLATGNRDFDGTSSVSVVLSRGSGDFEPAQHVVAGERLEALAVFDFDADGDPDLVTAGAELRAFENIGGGRFGRLCCCLSIRERSPWRWVICLETLCSTSWPLGAEPGRCGCTRVLRIAIFPRRLAWKSVGGRGWLR